MTNIKFIIEENKLKKEDIDATIIRDSNDTVFTFTLPEEWESYHLFCLVKTSNTNRRTFRLPIQLTSEGYLAEVPIELTRETLIKISVYRTLEDNRVCTNELILALDRGGYIEYRPPPVCHDHYPHNGLYHHHHCFPYAFYPSKTDHPYHPHFGSPKSPWGDSYRPRYPGKFGRHKENCHDKHHHHHHWHDEDIPKEGYVDIYEFVLSELKSSITSFAFNGNKCYAYHHEDLIQIIPLPDFVLRSELENFFGDVVYDVCLDEETGDLYLTKRTLNE